MVPANERPVYIYFFVDVGLGPPIVTSVLKFYKERVIGKEHVCGCAVLPTLSVSVIRHPHARRHETWCTVHDGDRRSSGRPASGCCSVRRPLVEPVQLVGTWGAESLGLIDLDVAAERVVSYRTTPAWRCTTTRRRRRSVVRFLVLGCMQSSLEKKNPQKMEADGECHVTGRRPTVARHVSGHPGDVLRPSIVSLRHQRSPSAPWTGMHMHLWSRHSTSLAHQLLVIIPRPILLQATAGSDRASGQNFLLVYCNSLHAWTRPTQVN